MNDQHQWPVTATFIDVGARPILNDGEIALEKLFTINMTAIQGLWHHSGDSYRMQAYGMTFIITAAEYFRLHSLLHPIPTTVQIDNPQT